jgi:hypothetical protein
MGRKNSGPKTKTPEIAEELSICTAVFAESLAVDSLRQGATVSARRVVEELAGRPPKLNR